MESDGCGLDRFEAPGKRLAQGVVDRKRTAILNENMAKFCKGPSFGEPKDFEGHFAKKPRGHRAHERGKVGLGQLVVERLIADIEQPLPGRNLIYLAYCLPTELENLS